MNGLYAVDLRAEGPEGAERLHALLSLVHGVNRGVSEPVLGIDFPQWQAGESAEDALRSVRLFGERLTLEMFLAQPGARRVCTALRRSSIHACLETERWARVCRDNAADKMKPSYQRRMARRHAESAHVVPARAAALTLPKTSIETKQAFGLRLRKVEAERPAEGTKPVFTSYGLCKEGALPQYPLMC
jgi:hypothetical protein